MPLGPFSRFVPFAPVIGELRGPLKIENCTQSVLMSSSIPRTAPARTSTFARSAIERLGPPT